MVEVLPVRSIGVSRWAKPVLSIDLSRPKILGGGNGSSPGVLGANVRRWVHQRLRPPT